MHPNCQAWYRQISLNMICYWTSLCKSPPEWTSLWRITLFTATLPPETAMWPKAISSKYQTLASGATNTLLITPGDTVARYFRCDGWHRKRSTRCSLVTRQTFGHTGFCCGNCTPLGADRTSASRIRKPSSEYVICNFWHVPTVALLDCTGWWGSVGKKAPRIDPSLPRLAPGSANGQATQLQRAISINERVIQWKAVKNKPLNKKLVLPVVQKRTASGGHLRIISYTVQHYWRNHLSSRVLVRQESQVFNDFLLLWQGTRII